MGDLLVNLYHMECKHDAEKLKKNGIVIKRAMSPDKEKVLEFMKTHYTEGWACEAGQAFSQTPVSCYIAIKDKKIVGVAAFDATARGYLGPIGIHTDEKGAGIGQSLLYETLMGMKEAGYGYAIIGWVNNAIGFYEKTINAIPIPDSEAENTIYSNLVQLN